MRTSQYIIASLASAASAARFVLHIPNGPVVNPSTFPSSTHATLQSSGPPIVAHLTRSNTFNFYNVTPGSYYASVYCRDFAFEPLRIDVSLEETVEGSGEKKEMIRAWQTFVGNEWDNKGESKGEGGNGLVIEAKVMGGKSFFQEREGFSPLSFLKNPMILMALFSMVLIFGMPYLVENMDPETKAEFEEMQKKGVLGSATGSERPNPAQQLQNFDLAAWMAGKTTDSGPSSRGQSPNPASKKRS